MLHVAPYFRAARALTQRVKHGAKFSCHGSKPIFLEDCPKKIVHLNNFLQKLNDTANGKPAIAGSKKRGKIVTLDNSMETPTPTKVRWFDFLPLFPPFVFWGGAA